MCSYTRVLSCNQAHRHTCAGNFAAVTNTPETVSHSRLLPIIYTRPVPATVCFSARAMDFSLGRVYRASKHGNRKVSVYVKEIFVFYFIFNQSVLNDSTDPVVPRARHVRRVLLKKHRVRRPRIDGDDDVCTYLSRFEFGSVRSVRSNSER